MMTEVTEEAASAAIRTATERVAGLVKTTCEVVASASQQPSTAADKRELFFPNGIELLYFKVEAGLTEKTKVSVEVKFAGEKGLRLVEDEAVQSESGTIEAL